MALLPAWASFRYLEEPIHRGRRLRSWSGLRVAAVAVAGRNRAGTPSVLLVKLLPNSSTVDAYMAAADARRSGRASSNRLPMPPEAV
jgi:hypothetical protein